MQYDKADVLHEPSPFAASLQGQDCWEGMHDGKASCRIEKTPGPC